MHILEYPSVRNKDVPAFYWPYGGLIERTESLVTLITFSLIQHAFHTPNTTYIPVSSYERMSEVRMDGVESVARADERSPTQPTELPQLSQQPQRSPALPLRRSLSQMDDSEYGLPKTPIAKKAWKESEIKALSECAAFSHYLHPASNSFICFLLS